MTDLVSINRKYKKIFDLLDKILFFAVFSPFIVIILSVFYFSSSNEYLILTFNRIFATIYVFILIFSIFFIIKGKTTQVKDFATATLGKCIFFAAISITIEFIIMLFFDYFNWFYAIALLWGSIFFIYFIYETYIFEGFFNLTLRKARRLRFKGKYDEALILFNELEAKNYNYPSIYFNLGFIYKDNKEYEKALEYFNKLINIEYNLKYGHDKELCTYAYEHKAFILRETKRYDEALEAIDKALVLRDDYDWSWNEKGYILYFLEKYEDSLYFFDKAIELNPTNQSNLYCKTNALIALERWDEANKTTDTLLNINQKDTITLNLKTEINIYKKNYHEALNFIEKSLKIDPNEYNTWYRKGYILFVLNRYEKAIIALKKALKIDNNSFSLEYMGICLEELGKIDEAKKYYNKALSYYDSLLNENKEDYYLLGKAFIFEKIGEFKKSLDICNEILKKDNQNTGALFRKAYTLGTCGKIDESLKFFNKLLKLKPEDSTVFCNIGWILCENGKFEKSLYYLNKALELDPNDFDTLHSKGYALEKIGKYKESLEYYEKVIKMNPEDYNGKKGIKRVLKKLKNKNN